MQKGNAFSEATPILIAGFFLVVPISVLLTVAQRQRVPIEDYKRAVRAAMQPDPSYVSHSLVPVKVNQPLTVVTWTRRDQIPKFQGETYKNTWVTVAPSLKSFCQDYVKAHGADRKQLTLRLEQRLGLPPGSNYDSFVEFKLDPKDISDVSRFFRLCDDPSPSTETCAPASPPKPAEIKPKLKALDPANSRQVEEYWLLSNYYWSFSSPSQYPWTSLGYTFDWAPREDGSEDFVRWGESEFVISPGVPIQSVSAVDTAAYCTPQ